MPKRLIFIICFISLPSLSHYFYLEVFSKTIHFLYRFELYCMLGFINFISNIFESFEQLLNKEIFILKNLKFNCLTSLFNCNKLCDF